MTFAEYLSWEGEHQFVEWVDGAALVLPTSPIRHGLLRSWLATLLIGYTQRHGLGQTLFGAYPMYLPHLRRARIPDVTFTRQARVHLFTEYYLDGPADVAVEIVSPESIGRDRGDKFIEYEAAGIPEYWYLDPQRQEAEFYRLDEAGRYRLAPVAEGVFRSQVINGFWLRVAWLWELPNELTVLRELGVIQ